MDTTCLDEWFLFHVITGRHNFYIAIYKFIIAQRFGGATMLLGSLKEVFSKKSTLYTHYLENKITMGYS